MLHKSEKQTYNSSQPTCILTRHFAFVFSRFIDQKPLFDKNNNKLQQRLNFERLEDCWLSVYTWHILYSVCRTLGEETLAKEGSDISLQKPSVIGNRLWDMISNLCMSQNTFVLTYRLWTVHTVHKYFNEWSLQFIIFKFL